MKNNNKSLLSVNSIFCTFLWRNMYNHKIETYKALFDIDLIANKGEVIGIFGLNAAGKTTLFNILSGCLAFSNGNIIINDKLVIDCNSANELRKVNQILIGGDIIEGNLNLITFCNKRLRENNLPELVENKNKLTNIDKNFLNLCNKLRFPIRNIYSSISSLSKGTKQKVSLIATLIIPSQIYLLDEPTVGLDEISCQKFGEIIRNYAKKHNSTIFLTSHNDKDLFNNSSKFYFLYDGKISESLDTNILSNYFISISLNLRFNILTNFIFDMNIEDVNEIFFKLSNSNLYVTAKNVFLQNIKDCIQKYLKLLFFNLSNNSPNIYIDIKDVNLINDVELECSNIIIIAAASDYQEIISNLKLDSIKKFIIKYLYNFLLEEFVNIKYNNLQENEYEIILILQHLFKLLLSINDCKINKQTIDILNLCYDYLFPLTKSYIMSERNAEIIIINFFQYLKINKQKNSNHNETDILESEYLDKAKNQLLDDDSEILV